VRTQSSFARNIPDLLYTYRRDSPQQAIGGNGLAGRDNAKFIATGTGGRKELIA
jgi:hypothetical protein